MDTVEMYANAIRKAKYPAALFFDTQRSIDTGMVSNIGRAHIEYKAITSMANEPITPFQTRNFGNLSSIKTQEDDVWDLCCAFNNKVSFIMPPAPTDKPVLGDNLFEDSLQMKGITVRQEMSDLKTNYLIPGQRKRD